MVKLYDEGAYLVNGTTLVKESESAKVEALTGKKAVKEEAVKVQSHTELWRNIILPATWIS